MKVIVRCANNRVTKAEMEREIERLFQENKDLRLSESHLRDELNLSQQQSEARRQVICERDKLIQELNDQITASETDAEFWKKAAAENAELAEQNITRVANVGADRDNFEAAYKQVLQWWEAAQSKAIEAEATADEYRIAAMESDCRVDECEKRMDWLSKEVLEWKATAEGYKNQYEELKAQKEADDKKSEEICTACNERYEAVLSERNRLRDRVKNYEESVTFAKMEEAMLTISRLRSEIALLTAERDTCVSENSELIFTINELQDKWEAEHNLRAEAEKKLESEQDQTKYWQKKHDEVTEEYNELEADYDALSQAKQEYGEEIDRLRRVVIELQTNRFTADEFIGMIMKNFMPSADK